MLLRAQVELLRALGTPFENLQRNSKVYFSHALYRLALYNKVALSYLSHCVFLDSSARRLYIYHRSRFEKLLNTLCNVCDILNKYGFKYAVFKTLRPFDEDVADIDIICLTSDYVEYRELEKVLSDAGYLIAERSLYCTTFVDARYHYVTELMIDIYREISAGPFVYLNKKVILDHVTTKHVKGYNIKVLDPVAELLVTVAHSLIKEMKIKLLDYLTALCLIYEMDEDSITNFVNLVGISRLIYGTRLFFSIAACLHELAYDFIPGKITKLLNMLGGAIDVRSIVSNSTPPYRLRPPLLIKIYAEKLGDAVFRQSIANSVRWSISRKSVTRLIRLVIHGSRV